MAVESGQLSVKEVREPFNLPAGTGEDEGSPSPDQPDERLSPFHLPWLNAEREQARDRG